MALRRRGEVLVPHRPSSRPVERLFAAPGKNYTLALLRSCRTPRASRERRATIGGAVPHPGRLPVAVARSTRACPEVIANRWLDPCAAAVAPERAGASCFHALDERPHYRARSSSGCTNPGGRSAAAAGAQSAVCARAGLTSRSRPARPFRCRRSGAQTRSHAHPAAFDSEPSGAYGFLSPPAKWSPWLPFGARALRPLLVTCNDRPGPLPVAQSRMNGRATSCRAAGRHG